MKGKKWLGWAALACAACCTLPFLIVGAGGLAAISADAWICGSILVLGAIAWFVISKRTGSAKVCASAGASSCSTGCGCKST